MVSIWRAFPGGRCMRWVTGAGAGFPRRCGGTIRVREIDIVVSTSLATNVPLPEQQCQLLTAVADQLEQRIAEGLAMTTRKRHTIQRDHSGR